MEVAEQIVDVLGSMKGAAMKVGQVASFIDTGAFPPEFQEHLQAKLAELRDSAPRVAFEEMRKVIEDDLGEPLESVFSEFEEEALAAASIGQVYRATPGGRPPGGREGPIPGRGRRRSKRPPEPGDDHAGGQADRAGHGRQGDDRRDPRAPLRRARLRARGAEPARVRPRVARAPVHRRAGGGHEPLRRARARVRVGRRRGLRGGAEDGRRRAQPLRRDRVPLLLRLALPQRPLLGRPPPGQLPPHERRPCGVLGLRDDQEARARPDRRRDRGDPLRDERRRRGPARGLCARGLPRPGQPRHHARGRARPLPRCHLVVRRGPRDPARLRLGHPGADRLRRPALRALEADAPNDGAAEGDAGAADGGAHVGVLGKLEAERQLAPDRARVALRRPALDGARRRPRSRSTPAGGCPA